MNLTSLHVGARIWLIMALHHVLSKKPFRALNFKTTSYRDQLGFDYIACRKSAPGLQRMLDYTDESIRDLELALSLEAPQESVRRKKLADA